MMEAQLMAGALPGSQAFLGSLQDATTKLWNELSTAESKKWSDQFPPPDIQAR